MNEKLQRGTPEYGEVMQQRIASAREALTEDWIVEIAEGTMNADFADGERMVSEKAWSDVVFGFVDLYDEERGRKQEMERLRGDLADTRAALWEALKLARVNLSPDDDESEATLAKEYPKLYGYLTAAQGRSDVPEKVEPSPDDAAFRRWKAAERPQGLHE